MHSFLLRLLPDPLALGEMVGEVEDVATGERHLVRTTGDLVEFCRRAVTSGGHGGTPAAQIGEQ